MILKYLCNCNFPWCTKPRLQKKKVQEEEIIHKSGVDMSCLQMTVQGQEIPWAPLPADRTHGGLWLHLQHLHHVLDYIQFLYSTFKPNKLWGPRSLWRDVHHMSRLFLRVWNVWPCRAPITQWLSGLQVPEGGLGVPASFTRPPTRRGSRQGQEYPRGYHHPPNHL